VKRWYVLRSKPRKETAVVSLLGSFGLEAYLPTIKTKSVRQEPIRSEPLFPGYLFSRLDPENSEVGLVNRTANVLYILGYGEEPWAVPDELISSIQTRLASPNKRHALWSFHSGETVLIANGPFQGIEAIFDSYLSAAGRVRVLIKALRSAYRADLDANTIRPIRQTAEKAGV